MATCERHLEKGTHSIMQICQSSSDHDSKRVEIYAALRGRALSVNKDAYSKRTNLFSLLVHERIRLTFVKWRLVDRAVEHLVNKAHTAM